MIMEIDKLKSRLAEKELKLTLNESMVSRASVLTPKNDRSFSKNKINNATTQTAERPMRNVEL